MPFLGPNLAQKDFKIVNTQSPQSLLQDSVKNIEKLLPYMQRVIVIIGAIPLRTAKRRATKNWEGGYCRL